MADFAIDLTGLEHKWSRIRHENCCDCGMNFEENDEYALRMWRNALDWNRSDELALCWKCAEKRMGKAK